MSLVDRIVSDLKDAMKARDAERLSVLRMLKARLMEAQIAKRTKEGADARLADDDALSVLAAYAKQRREAAGAYRKGDRADLAEKEERELAVVEGYLPAALSEEELRALVDAAIAECGATDARQMGGVMKALMPKVRGRADGKRVSAMVREALS